MARVGRFTVSLSLPRSIPVSVDWHTVAGTAVAPSDFTALIGSLTFAPGETSKTIDVPVREDVPGNAEEQFTVVLSNPSGCRIVDDTGVCVLPGTASASVYVSRFNWIYANLHDAANGYFGPPTGPKARTVPYHCPETIVAEAPDWGHESVSETVSFWIGLEAWKGLLSNDWSGYSAAWASIEANYIPSAANQPVGVYDPSDPADYMPEGDLPSAYPVLGDSSAAVGVDPLADELSAAYGNNRMYLMHWIIDVDGVYGFHNGDGQEKVVYINNYQRGLQESCFESITHPSWEDYDFGNAYGFLPIFSKGKPTYGEAEFDYSKQWRYTCAPDAEARVVQYAWWAKKFAAENGAASAVSSATTKARKMGDYLRYSLFDKYFRKIGDDRDEGSTSGAPYAACHYLVSWYVAWGGEVPAPSATSQWGFRIGSSESHHGYQAPDIAYAMATGGGGFTPATSSSGDIWLGSLYRQIEMLRWLQSPEGPIAGGVSNSWKGRYETPTDGRQSAKFYGMFYTYAPVWHDPPSNNWFGFQCWGLQRSASLLLEVVDNPTTLGNAIRPNLEIILDRFVNFVLDEVTLGEGNAFTLPDTLSWTSPTQVVGQTTTTPNLEGVYEFIPSLNWNGSGDYGAFWNASTVPNPNLHCEVVATGSDLGVASCLANLLIHYAQAKRLQDKFTDAIPNGSHTAEDAYDLAKALLDRIWDGYRDDKGITRTEARADYSRMGDPIYVPASYSGTMPNGDVIDDEATFVSIRSFYEDDPGWAAVAAYIDDPENEPAPEFTYHRFWAQCEYAMSCAAMHRYFADLAEA